MKIKQNVWNIKRKGKRYWLSFVFLLFPSLFVNSITRGPIFFISQYVNIEATGFLGRHFAVLRLLNFILLVGLVILLIMVIEICFFIGKGIKNKVEISESLYSFIYFPQFRGDILILIATIGVGLFESYQNMKWFHLDSIIFILFSTVFLIGIYINFSCIFPWQTYRKIQNSIKEKKEFFQEAWICIPMYTKISTFSLLPGKCEYLPIVVTEKELSIINKKNNCEVRGSDFNKLLVYIDKVIDREEFWNTVEKYSLYLHLKCLVILKDESQGNLYEREINILRNRLDAQIIYGFQDIYSLDMLEECLGIKYTFNVVKCLKEGKSLQNWAGIFDDIYSNIAHGPAVAVKFFRSCLTEPNLSKAIYLFLDYIDLQYRLVCAFFAPVNLNWYVKKSNDIGNLRQMFNFFAGSLKKLILIENTDIETKDFLNDDMWDMLERYLPNNSKDFRNKQKFNIEDIKNLSAELRNRLRAHQDIELIDVPKLLNLVYRIAIITNYILGINQMVIGYGYDGNLTGSYKTIVGKPLSPFIEQSQECCWIFNNAKKKCDYIQMEYIDFLTGSIKSEKKRENN